MAVDYLPERMALTIWRHCGGFFASGQYGELTVDQIGYLVIVSDRHCPWLMCGRCP